MQDRSAFKYPLRWHTRFPQPGALAENRKFFQHESPEEIKKRFASRKQTHPYIMANDKDFAQLKSRIQSDETAAAYYKELYRQAEELLNTEPPTSPERHTLQNRLNILCLIYKISGERRFFDRAWKELERYCGFSTWAPTEKLDDAVILKGAAIGYDWLYDELTTAQREIVRTAILKNSFWTDIEVFRNPYREGLDVHYIMQNTNHNLTINCGIIMAALALMDTPELTDLCSELVSDSMWALENYVPEFLEYGCGKEGVYYWYWPMNSLSELIASLTCALGCDYDLSKTPGFDKMGFFPVYMTGVTGLEFNWGNAKEDTYAIAESMYALSLILKDSRFALCRKTAIEVYHQAPGAYDLLWYRPFEASFDDFPKDMCFRRTESKGMFTRVMDPNGTSVCFKGGYNNEVHGSLCGGSFVIDAMGQRWASLIGAEKYSVPHYWDYSEFGTRWTYYRMRAEGQNAMVINPGDGPDQYPLAFCPIIKSDSREDESFAVVNLHPAFSNQAGITAAARGAKLTDGRSRVVIQDEVLGTDMDYWWMMHTIADIEISKNGKEAVLQQNGKKMFVRLVSKQDACFEILPAAPLPGCPAPAENSPNPGFRKLAVHIPHTDAVVLSVQFSPETGCTDPIPLTALADW